MSDPRRDVHLFHRVRRAVRRRRHRRTNVLHVRIWADDLDGGYVVQCVEIPGCISQGETADEALANIADALTEMFEVIIRESRAATQEPAARGEVRSLKIAVNA